MTSDPAPGRPADAQPRTRRRWAVPLAAGAVIAAAVLAPHALASGGHPTLPSRSVADLLAAMGRSTARGVSGELRTVADLGLPRLPTTEGSSQLLDLIAGAAELHVWSDDSSHVRVALLGTGQEMDVVHDGASTWTWNSSSQTATSVVASPATRRHTTRPGPLGLAPAPGPAGGVDLTRLTPSALGRWAGRFIGRDTAVSLGPTTVVAGRPAYDLRIAPRTGDTLLSRIDVALDAATGSPLQVQLWSRELADHPALQVGYTAVSFDSSPASEFTFRPPVGAHVVTDRLRAADVTGRSGARIFGTGWAAVVASPPLHSGSPPLGSGSTRSASNPLASVTSSVPGGRLLATNLLSVFLGDDGRVLAGLVPAEQVQQIADRMTPVAGAGS